MTRSGQRSRARRWLAGFAALVLLTGAGLLPASVAAHNWDHTVLDWNTYAVDALSNASTDDPPVPGQPPPVASIHLAMVQGAVYDAVNAIDGRRYEPYFNHLPKARSSASKAAAAATAAHDVLVGLRRGSNTAPFVLGLSTRNNLDTLLAASLAGIRDGSAKTNGKRIGAAVAARMLAERSADGRYGPFRFTAGGATSPAGVWRLTASGINDPNAWVAEVEPFTLRSRSQFRTRGPLALTSARYAAEFNEVKRLGSNVMPSERNPEQTALAVFFSANPLPIMNQALRNIAGARGLSTAQQARLFAMSSMSGADALIGCWDDKKRWSFWRPETAINMAADDGNPDTSPAASTWVPFFANPPYPDHPSGYNCFTAAMMYTARNYFGTDRITFTLTSPGITPATPITRTYTRFSAVPKDTIDGRVYMGIHFRTPDVQGAQLGQKVANWVADRYFEPVRHGHR